MDITGQSGGKEGEVRGAGNGGFVLAAGQGWRGAGKVGRLETRSEGRPNRGGRAAGVGSAECREPGLEETPGDEERELSGRGAGSGGSKEATAFKGRPGSKRGCVRKAPSGSRE